MEQEFSIVAVKCDDDPLVGMGAGYALFGFGGLLTGGALGLALPIVLLVIGMAGASERKQS